jgi:hypothetical protein
MRALTVQRHNIAAFWHGMRGGVAVETADIHRNNWPLLTAVHQNNENPAAPKGRWLQ